RDAIYVYDKSESREVLFTSLNDFDSENKDWGFQLNRIDSSSRAFSGQFGWTIGGKNLGTPTIEQSMSKFSSQKQFQLVYSLKALIPDGTPKDARIYMQVLREKKQVWQTSDRIDIYAQNNTDWFDVTVVAVPDIEIREGDVLRAFVWSSPSEPFYVDDTRITVHAID
ncbi:MAG TPA: hypothetical protein DCR04_09230, partial [Flavobacteriales bacterium]|nr:hypothetical protein [Flavobacteriales bacterium]